MIKRNHIETADALDYARSLPAESVNCIVTSPPYWGLRDYGVSGQMGLEQSFPEFIANLVELFRELRRVLRSDGTCWVNMGDAYNSSPAGQNPGGFQGAQMRKNSDYDSAQPRVNGKGVPMGSIKVKELLGQPWRLAFALQDDGWYLRRDIIWSKPNPMPESAKDRPTTAHEYVFLLTKAPRYWYDADAVRVSKSPNAHAWKTKHVGDKSANANHAEWSKAKMNRRAYDPPTANLKSVWTIPTQPFAAAHFATFPEKLAATCIKAGAPKKVCADCGAPWVRGKEFVGVKRVNFNGYEGQKWQREQGQQKRSDTGVFGSGNIKQYKDHGLQPACDCDAGTLPGIVYDPFMGAGTTALVAQKLGRDYIGSELNPEYADLARARVAGRLQEYQDRKAGKPTTEYMFKGQL